MTDFGANYSEMEAVSGKLTTGKEDIDGVLTDLKTAVDTLLGEDFKTQHMSGKFGDGYEELTTGLQSAVEGIQEMSESLMGMMQKIQELDGSA